jgi:hypothetical protein
MACEAPGISSVRCAGALGHVVLEGGGDVAVVLADHEPGGHVAPEGPLAGRFGERLLRDRPLRGGHPRGLRGGHVGAELLVEALGGDVQVGGAVAARDGPECVAECAAREHARQREGALAGFGREAAGVDEPDDFAGVGRDARDHRAAVGVGGENDGPVDRTDDVGDGGGVRGEAAQRVGGGDHRVSGVEQRVDDAIPARGLGEGAVDENDRGWHGGRSFRFWWIQ